MGCFSCSGNSDKRIVKKRTYNYIDKYLQNERDYQTQNERDYQTKPISDMLNAHPSKNDEELRVRKDPEFVDKSFPRKVSDVEDGVTDGIKAETFTFYQLVAATENFKSEYFLGEGGFGKVYKGVLVDSGQVVAIKQLNHHGSQGIREFIVEVSTLGQCDHTNLVKLIGYCAEGDQRLLVYEYMPLGSLEDHLHGFRPDMRRLDWNTRMELAAGAARGLEYLHNKIKPPIIYRDLKCSNILLDEGYHPKLSDFGLAKVGPEGDETHVSTRVMGTYGYCAPDYAMTGQLTFKSDIYSFGVVLLEIITGRRAIDFTRSAAEQNLVSWARPLFKDRKNFLQMADPALKGQYPVRGLYQAIAIAALCVQEQPTMRPQATDVVTALNYLASHPHDPQNRPVQGPQRAPTTYRKIKDDNQKLLAGNEQERTKLED